MARTWLSVRVDLISGGGQECWPRPGRIFAAARGNTFAQLATAIDAAFARWDLSHLHSFTLADGTELVDWRDWDGEHPDGSLDSRTTKLSQLKPGEQFAYVFDLGDYWAHLCTVGPQRIDPLETLGVITPDPRPYWGWGSLPDQYGREWDGDDGESVPPKRPDSPLGDLPPILPWWGPDRR